MKNNEENYILHTYFPVSNAQHYFATVHDSLLSYYTFMVKNPQNLHHSYTIPLLTDASIA